MKDRRLFFAFLPDEGLREALRAACQRLYPLSGRPVPAANLHLTAAFLGAVPEPRLAAIQSLSGAVKPSRVELSRLELWGKPRVLVAGAPQPPAALARQVDELWQRLERLGFARDPRPFKPHVTLVRDIRSLRDRVVWAPVIWPCERLWLMQSVSTPEGVRYKPIA